VVQARKAQAAISGSPERAAPPRPINLPPAYGSDSFLHAHLHAMSQQKEQAPQQQPIHRPTMPVDSKLIMEQRRLAQLKDHGVRNRFSLLPDKGTPDKIHQTADAYETAFATETKHITPGKIQGGGRTFGPEQGASTGVKLDSYYVQFHKGVQSQMIPKKADAALKQWQGVRPTIPVSEFTNAAINENMERIREADVRTPMPAPQVPTDAFMLQFSKDTGAQQDPIRYGGMPDAPPQHAYDNLADFSSAVTPAKGDAGGSKDEFVGVRPNMGSDSYMQSFAKTVSAFTPSKLKSKETAKAPTNEVTL